MASHKNVIMGIVGDRNVSKEEPQKLSAPPEADALMYLMIEVNRLMDGMADTAENYARISGAVREGLGVFCVAIVHVGNGFRSASNLTVCALSTAVSFRPSELSD